MIVTICSNNQQSQQSVKKKSTGVFLTIVENKSVGENHKTIEPKTLTFCMLKTDVEHVTKIQKMLEISALF